MRGYPPGSIWPATDDEERQIREVYARYGLAMYRAQVLEHGLVNTLAVFRLLPAREQYPDRQAWEIACDSFYDAEFDKTFGNILKALQLIKGFPPELLHELRLVKRKRDHLAHSFFRRHDIDSMTTEGRTEMITECEQLIELFHTVDRKVEQFIKPLEEMFGLTEERIKDMIEQMQQEARKAATT